MIRGGAMNNQPISSPARLTRPRTVKLIAILSILLAVGVVSGAGVQYGYAETSGQPDGEVVRSFEVAARHWNVPLPVAMAVGYVESHWDQRDGAPSTDMGYGIMHIVDRLDGTLDRAAKLTGLSP